jgi:hypothetical protein
MDRPSFSLLIQAKIEQARHDVFKGADSRFDMLFFPILPAGILGVDWNVKNVPVQRKPATLKLQLAEYAAALYDAEAIHYSNLAPSNEEFALWLGNLAERINKEVRNVAEDERHNIHCVLQDRLSAVTDALAARAQWWSQAKQRVDSKPIASRAPRPIVPVATTTNYLPRPEQQERPVRPEASPGIESGRASEKPPNRKDLRLSYLAQFPNEKIKVLDICWAAGQRYSEWKRWLRNAVKDGSTPDIAFRGILSSDKRPREYKKQPRPDGWK